MTPEELLAMLPKQCVFCGTEQTDQNGLHVQVAYDADGNIRTSALCSNCIRTFLLSMSHDHRDEFERLVEEARTWKPDYGEPENSN
jgi:hypothetical protein